MSKSIRWIRQLAILVLFMMLYSCYYDVVSDDSDPEGVISFSQDIQPIFDSHCISCHPSISPNPDLTEGNSYNSINNGIYIIPEEPETSLLYQRMLGNPGIMPPSGRLSDPDIALVRVWIEQGALNN